MEVILRDVSFLKDFFNGKCSYGHSELDDTLDGFQSCASQKT